MSEDFVSYDLAVRLKAAGFDEPCRYYHSPKGILRPAKDNALSPEALNNRFLDEIADGVCTAVPLWQAQKWLREQCGFQCQVLLNGVRSMFFWQVREMIGNGRYADSTHQYDVYEDAMSDSIAAALELIEKKGE